MKPKSKIQKGKDLESYVIDQIIKKGLSDNAGATSSGRIKRDKRDVNSGNMMILDRTAGIECKNYKKAHIQDWWRQTQKLEQQGYEPILVYKLGGESYGDTKAVVYLNTLLDLIKNQKGEYEPQSGIPNSEKWVVKQGIEVLKKILKLLEKYG